MTHEERVEKLMKDPEARARYYEEYTKLVVDDTRSRVYAVERKLRYLTVSLIVVGVVALIALLV